MQAYKVLGFRIVLPAIVLLVLFSMTINANAYETLKSRKNMVTVDVRPVQLSPGQPARFDIGMEPHSVDLSYDMVAAGILKDDQGTSIVRQIGTAPVPVAIIAVAFWRSLHLRGTPSRSPL